MLPAMDGEMWTHPATVANVGRLREVFGYVVVTPDALGEPRDWNYFGNPARTDDFGFVDALVANLSERLCIDADRIFNAGLLASLHEQKVLSRDALGQLSAEAMALQQMMRGIHF